MRCLAGGFSLFVALALPAALVAAPAGEGRVDQARVDASQIITIETLPTTTRLLAFSYYGNDEFGEVITDLNDIADVSFIEGPIEVLTA